MMGFHEREAEVYVEMMRSGPRGAVLQQQQQSQRTACHGLGGAGEGVSGGRGWSAHLPPSPHAQKERGARENYRSSPWIGASVIRAPLDDSSDEDASDGDDDEKENASLFGSGGRAGWRAGYDHGYDDNDGGDDEEALTSAARYALEHAGLGRDAADAEDESPRRHASSAGGLGTSTSGGSGDGDAAAFHLLTPTAARFRLDDETTAAAAAALGSGGLRAVSRARAVSHQRAAARRAAARAAAQRRKESLELELAWALQTEAEEKIAIVAAVNDMRETLKAGGTLHSLHSSVQGSGFSVLGPGSEIQVVGISVEGSGFRI